MTAAKNSAKDARRRRAVAEANAPFLVEDDMDTPGDTIDTVSDDYLRLIFTCCHPELSSANQIALTLKVVAGFSTEEIARAFVCSEATVSQRILRAKQTLEERKVGYAIPEPDDLARYQRAPDEPDDFRHRMLANIAAFAFTVALTAVSGLIYLWRNRAIYMSET